MVGYPKAHVKRCSWLYVLLCVCPFLCQKLLLNCWADFLQTWWEGAQGEPLCLADFRNQRSKVKLSENRFLAITP